jgi:glutathione S-transferase
MKLYYSPRACSLAVHIVLVELKLNYQLVQVNLTNHQTELATDFRQINPKGYVPALELDNGLILTEVTSILQYLAEHYQAETLLPPAPALTRYRILEWLNYLATEIHKNFAPLFNPRLPATLRPFFIKNLTYRCQLLEQQLQDQTYLVEPNFSIADAYLFTLLGWSDYLDLSLPPTLKQYQQRLLKQPAVAQAMQLEPLPALAVPSALPAQLSTH